MKVLNHKIIKTALFDDVKNQVEADIMSDSDFDVSRDISIGLMFRAYMLSYKHISHWFLIPFEEFEEEFEDLTDVLIKSGFVCKIDTEIGDKESVSFVFVFGSVDEFEWAIKFKGDDLDAYEKIERIAKKEKKRQEVGRKD